MKSVIQLPVLLMMAILVGCGSSGPSPNATLSGKVTVDGTAAPAGTTVQFTDQASGRVAIGVVGADGTYEATMNGVNQVFAGDYVVTVTGGAVEVDPEAAMQPGFVAPENPIPAKYQDAKTSGEKVTVSEGANTFDLDIKK